MLIIAMLGILLSMYLWYIHISANPGFCTASCGSIITGEYGIFLNMPWGFWGLLFYTGMTGLLMLRSKKVIFDPKFCLIEALRDFRRNYLLNWDFLFKVGLVWGWIVTLYLRYLEFSVLHEFCLYCWGSVVLMILLSIGELVVVKRN